MGPFMGHAPGQVKDEGRDLLRMMRRIILLLPIPEVNVAGGVMTILKILLRISPLIPLFLVPSPRNHIKNKSAPILRRHRPPFILIPRPPTEAQQHPSLTPRPRAQIKGVVPPVQGNGNPISPSLRGWTRRNRLRRRCERGQGMSLGRRGRGCRRLGVG
jgi:hypothetical protein